MPAGERGRRRRALTHAKDVGEREILKALDTAKEAAIVVSPIGQQGFVLGRGNLQISPPCCGGWA